MKKKIAVLLALVLACMSLCGVTLADNEGTASFTAVFTSLLNQTAKEWFATSSDRALLTVSLLADAMAQTEWDLTAVAANSSWVAISESGRQLLVAVYDDNAIYVITLYPDSGAAEMAAIKGISGDNSIIELLMPKILEGIDNTAEYYKNSQSDIISATEALIKLMEGLQ